MYPAIPPAAVRAMITRLPPVRRRWRERCTRADPQAEASLARLRSSEPPVSRPEREARRSRWRTSCHRATRRSASSPIHERPSHRPGRRHAYPERVRFEIAASDVASYRRAADFLNVSPVDLVSVQHEYGIFGGKAGFHVLALLRELRMPIVTTL